MAKKSDENKDNKNGNKKDNKNDSKTDADTESEDVFEKAAKDNKRFTCLKKLIIHLCVIITVLAVQYFVLGICALIFYKQKTHLFVFGLFCVLHLIGAPLGYLAIKRGNRLFFLILAILNIAWLVCTLILIVLFVTIIDNEQFPNEIALHVDAFFYSIFAITLAVCCFLMMRQLDMIKVEVAAPTVKYSAKGKASKK